ncbi:nitroreductase family protein [Negadavirga shengliensis]|uniref:Nitroreductase family protein n=1 Tax=Negadavirga shengliensis TaxID=1389218 RepID=A0ABV9SWE4_9BACT
MLLDLYEPMGKEWQENRCVKQAYISFTLALAAAAEQKVDVTPMEGFDNTKMDEFLGLEELQLKSVVIMPIGYREEANDWLLNLKKWRTPKDEFVTEYPDKDKWKSELSIPGSGKTSVGMPRQLK